MARITAQRPPIHQQTTSRVISWRSVLLGLAGVVLINVVTPYNDYVLTNTFVVGNSLPLGAMLLFFVVAIGVNAPLSRWMPRAALTSGELGIAFSMVLLGCSFPSSGLMRYLPSSLVYPFWQARSNPETLELLQKVRLARWLYPTFDGDSPAQWMNDPVVTGYAGRWTGEGMPPYFRWVRPMITWGIYVGLLYGAFLFLLTILRRQWFENERLAFPLATIEASLVEAPAHGRFLNTTLSTASFWVCFALAFLLHGFNALHLYWPRYFPQLPLSFDLGTIMADPPWSYADGSLKAARLFLTAAGVAYFLPGSVSFSLWFFYILFQVQKMVQGSMTGDAGTPGQDDRILGGLMAYCLIVLWIGRAHWLLVVRQAFRGHREGEPEGRYCSYRMAFWGLVATVLGLVVWMTLAGATIVGSAVIALTLLGTLFIVARIVAETGFLHPGVGFSPIRNWTLLGQLGWSHPTSTETVLLSGQIHTLHHDTRETVGVFSSHGMRVTDQTVYAGRPMASDGEEMRRLGRRIMLLMAVVLLVGYVSSFSSMLWVEYTYAVDKTPQAKVVNDYAGTWAPLGCQISPTMAYRNNQYNSASNPAVHVPLGAAITMALSILRLHFVWWPLHPIGYLCASTWPMSQLWFAIFVGWLTRTLILRFGGSSMYTRARPAMIGVIIGEAVAAGFWLVVAMALSLMGKDYKPVPILPA